MGTRKYYLYFCTIVAIIICSLVAAYFGGWWIPNNPSLAVYPVRGIDISHHQGKIDWKAVATSGISFAFIKASEGSDFQDERFLKNLREATQAGIPCGAYHFFTLKASGLSQAQNFIRTVPKNLLRLPPVVDLETWGDTSSSSIQNFQLELNTFMEELRKAYGTEPILYTSSDYMQVYLKAYSIKRLWLRARRPGPRHRPARAEGCNGPRPGPGRRRRGTCRG